MIQDFVIEARGRMAELQILSFVGIKWRGANETTTCACSSTTIFLSFSGMAERHHLEVPVVWVRRARESPEDNEA